MIILQHNQHMLHRKWYWFWELVDSDLLLDIVNTFHSIFFKHVNFEKVTEYIKKFY